MDMRHFVSAARLQAKPYELQRHRLARYLNESLYGLTTVQVMRFSPSADHDINANPISADFQQEHCYWSLGKTSDSPLSG